MAIQKAIAHSKKRPHLRELNGGKRAAREAGQSNKSLKKRKISSNSGTKMAPIKDVELIRTKIAKQHTSPNSA